ncbi:F-box/LRR-repeat/kelch-repeat protein At1g09650-like [Cannabis sativa]|uniref:F-box/LRR-repeat/kelch-repeat protein At1g09650-like n=1 Tax=Cannabis sativa TaxID=3483 RepID=UPI0029CA9701|nr:F-box/LRR-repeat/kelch-repeat protein At1g09650-like [Cannabis sativa]
MRKKKIGLTNSQVSDLEDQLKAMATDKAESPQTKKEYDNSFDSIQTNINFGKTSKFWQLPEELVERILLSLDADSLTICKFVCKSWFNMIERRYFVNKHLLGIAKMNMVNIFIGWVHLEESAKPQVCCTAFQRFSMISFCEGGQDDDDDDYLSCVIEEVKFPPISPPVMEEDAEDLPLGCVVFHCNGIIHIFDEESATSAILFNPALKEFKFLSLPEIHEEFDEV